MGIIKKNFEKVLMKEAGKRLNALFQEFSFNNLVGKTTKECDRIIFLLLQKYDLESPVYNYHGFPGYSCISLNNVLVHGVPSDEVVIQEDDIVKIDICARYKGYCADMARPFLSDKLSHDDFRKMDECGKKALENALHYLLPNKKLYDVSNAIEKTINDYGFSVARDFMGHGIGKSMHEFPNVPNYITDDYDNIMLFSGMALAIEPMFCQKSADLFIDKKDLWSAKTVDGYLTYHIEDTIIIDDNGPFIITRQ